jgi:hypothetical protein
MSCAKPIDFLIKIAKKVKLGNLRKEIKKFRRNCEKFANAK